MASALWGKFASEVLKEVKFKYDHNGIRQELIEHMEELYEDLQAEGMDASGAEIMTVVYMGDAKEIGQALNQEHSPILGWLWLIGRVLAMAFLVWASIAVLPSVMELYKGISAQYIEKMDSPLVYTVPLEEEWNIRGERIRLHEARYYEDGTLEIRGDSRDWDRSHWHTSGLCRNMSITDAEGNLYAPVGMEENEICLGSGMFFRTQMLFEDVPSDTDEIIFCYDWFTGESELLSLTESREVAE